MSAREKREVKCIANKGTAFLKPREGGNSCVHSSAIGWFKDISQHLVWFYSQSLFLKMCVECALDLPQPDYLTHPLAPH